MLGVKRLSWAFDVWNVGPGSHDEQAVEKYFRQVSLLIHPDKANGVGAAEAYRRCSKAKEALLESSTQNHEIILQPCDSHQNKGKARANDNFEADLLDATARATQDQTDLQRQLQGLCNHLRAEGLTHNVVLGLGDCQFEAFSRGLLRHRGLRVHAERLRQESCDWLATELKQDPALNQSLLIH